MQGYDVVTSDEHKIGHVVGEEGDYLIIERGTIFKSKHALPKTFAHTDEADEVVRVTVSKELIEGSPKLENGSLDEQAVAEHYGLAEGFEAPDTQGYGEVRPDDPARSAEEEELRTGVEPAAQERARIRGVSTSPSPRRLRARGSLLSPSRRRATRGPCARRPRRA